MHFPVPLVVSSTVSKPRSSSSNVSSTTSVPPSRSEKSPKNSENSEINSLGNGGKFDKNSKLLEKGGKLVESPVKIFEKNADKLEKVLESKLSENSTSNKESDKGWKTSDLYEGGHSDANAALCPDGGQTLRLLIVITSAPAHREARLAIRQTWGHYGSR